MHHTKISYVRAKLLSEEWIPTTNHNGKILWFLAKPPISFKATTTHNRLSDDERKILWNNLVRATLSTAKDIGLARCDLNNKASLTVNSLKYAASFVPDDDASTLAWLAEEESAIDPWENYDEEDYIIDD